MLAVEHNPIRIQAIQQEIVNRLQKLANRKTARTAQRFFPEKIACFGVRAADLRALCREVYKKVKPAFSIPQALELAESLFYWPELECRSCGLLLLGFFHSGLKKPHLEKIKSWLKNGYLDNWALIDTLCMEVLGPFFLKNPDRLRIIAEWSKDDSPYLRRAALVSLVKLTREQENLDFIFRTLKLAVRDNKEEDLVAKAAGWLLREAGKTDRQLLENFLLSFGSKLPRVAVRYALEKFPPGRREYFMKKTKINNSRRPYD